jgi:hypothetical protein
LTQKSLLDCVFAKLKENKYKMNEKVLRIFGGLPVKREPYKVELENIFGFAYSDDDGNWHKEVGFFPYLWGACTLL